MRDHLPYHGRKHLRNAVELPFSKNEENKEKIQVSQNNLSSGAQSDKQYLKSMICSSPNDAGPHNIGLTVSAVKEVTSGELQIRSGWRSVAMVLDRFFFFLYLLLVITALVAIFPRP